MKQMVKPLLAQDSTCVPDGESQGGWDGASNADGRGGVGSAQELRCPAGSCLCSL